MKKLLSLVAASIALLVGNAYANGVEPQTSIVPCVTYHEYVHGVDKCRAAMFGVEHRYEKHEGFNTKLHLSAMKYQNKMHMQFFVEGLYKFQAQKDICVYPVATLSWHRFGVSPLGEELAAYHWKNCFHLGLGIEKSYESLLVIGLRGSIVQDLDSRTFGEYGRTFVGARHGNSTAYKFVGYFHLKALHYGVIELEPFFGKCFEGKYREHGVKGGFRLYF